ncbi:hypothetical protein CCHR01_19923 [Colletotrichum chrysophilum]|uniref:Uncharacterized protein n=1 Tax=Colletotrichum chrysophilum TaxID=1836956 RepID=A0AAD8ZXR0_9PEZI|nr:hypothetical protein CCHR01_19923 [Colletotrichum chrysophilum]
MPVKTENGFIGMDWNAGSNWMVPSADEEEETAHEGRASDSQKNNGGPVPATVYLCTTPETSPLPMRPPTPTSARQGP